MGKTLLTYLLLILVTDLAGQGATFQWSKKPADGSSVSNVSSVAVDGNGNVYTLGEFQGLSDFDPGIATYTLQAPPFGFNMYITKLDAAGNFLWAHSVGDQNRAMGTSIKIDGSGNCYVTGGFFGTIDFDPGPGTFSLTASAGFDIFALKFDAAGNFVWARNMPGISPANNVGTSLGLDQNANVYICGSFRDVVDFDPGIGTFTMTTNGGFGSDQAFILKLSAAGNFLWAKQLQTTISSNANSIAVDALGNSHVTGSFGGITDFNPGVATYTIASPLSPNMYILKLDNAGNFVWAKEQGGSSQDEISTAIALDNNGNVFTTGWYQGGTPDFDPGPSTYTLATPSSVDAFVSKLDASGNFVWAKQIVGAGSMNSIWAFAYAISSDVLGNVYFTGKLAGSYDFDAGPGTYNLVSPGFNNHCIFIAKFSPTGNFTWVKSFNANPGSSGGNAITTDAGGNIYTAGQFSNTVDFDPGPATYTMGVVFAPQAFVHKLGFCLAPAAPVSNVPQGTLTVCSNSSVSLSATANGPLAWYLGSIPSAVATGTTFTIPVLSAGIYSYYVGTSDLCFTSSLTAITITVNLTPTISVNSGVLCSGQSFTIVPAGASNYIYSGGSNIVTPLVNTAYTITGASTQGCLSANTVVCTVSVFPVPVISVNSGSICSGQSFTIIPVGAQNYTYSGGGSVVMPAISTSYLVTGISSQGCLGTALSSVTVNSTPTITVNSGSICSGNSFTIVPAGASNYTYTGGSNIVTPFVNTAYSVTGSSNFGCIGNSVVSMVNVSASPTIVASGTVVTICAGESITLSAGGANNYAWTTGATSSLIVVNPAVTTTYIVTGTDNNGCTGTFKLVQTVNTCAGFEDYAINGSQLAAYPNPNNGDFYLSPDFSVNTCYYQLFDNTGKLIEEGINETNGAKREFHFSNKNYEAGLYLLRLEIDGRSSIIKFIQD